MVVGDDNHTASADDGSAAVGGSGTAIGISDINIGGEEFGLVSLEDGAAADVGASTDSINGFFGGGDDATLAFGIDNTVASAHLDSFVTGLALAVNLCDCEEGQTTTITTGHIFHNNVSSASGANRVVYNTGIANQGRALAVASENSFSN